MKKLILLSLCQMMILVSASGQDRISGKTWAGRSEVIAQNGMVCTSHPLSTQAGIEILRAGGNAIDAAIAANAMEGVVEPHVNGIGGDIFAIVWDNKTKKLYGLNGSGRSPYSLTLAEFKKRGLTHIPSTGPLPVSVPGCVDGWFELHKKFGSMPMERILSHAIQYARNGFPVHDELAGSLRAIPRIYGQYPNVKEHYYPNGEVPKKGDIFKNPNLANTLEKIAKGGRDVFYKGEIARTIDAFFKKVGGYLSYKDLADHTSTWVEPVSTNYRGYDVWELPPNGQGIAALQMLNILEGYDFSKIPWGSPEHIHLFVEAKKIVFEDRAKFYSDMDFVKIPVRSLISKEYADERRKLINPDRALSRIDAGNPALKDGDTIYLTVADKDGNMVSLIQSNYRGFGSGMMADGLGFMFQDRGELYSLTDGQNNTYAPHKRPFHTIIPAFMTKDGQPIMSFGVMGGGYQPLGHVEIVMDVVDFGMNVQEAGDAPRIDHDGSSEPTGEKMEGSGTVMLESGFPYETIRELMRKGHKVGYGLGGYGGYQCIRFDPIRKVYFGASESRKDGQAAGY
ncbi:MAG: gamma-glutamyltransferase [Saprospiraceae bacterium]|jgi:gamma-glutamyltranspeptidase/glutathione hydrolase|nr:gamma-glutamyltransferase [Saprospiraceae bacterium]MBK6481021.1 gamma-glutamyltransferase [Saprospiraceae bacterium]MBK7439244.1 gamma-glutamyltransferase [Saprospiraceae bacterium]MBK8282649.1 gamma-glutamyltransferase [Saprospiraceae bacterium]MBP7924365.1 gamma-glutamyltransferase [Saprospiraceae bacterium]